MLLIFIVFVSTFLIFSFIHYASKKKKPFKRALLSMLLGIATLCTVNILSGLTGVYIPVTQLSLFTALAGGIPGTALLVLLSVF